MTTLRQIQHIYLSLGCLSDTADFLVVLCLQKKKEPKGFQTFRLNRVLNGVEITLIIQPVLDHIADDVRP